MAQIPVIHEPDTAVNTIATLERSTSDSSDISEWTVTDRGESLYHHATANAAPMVVKVDSDQELCRSNDVIRALRMAKCRCKERTYSTNSFFPKTVMEQIIVKSTVAAILSSEDPDLTPTEVEFYSTQICRTRERKSNELSYRKMFTILLLIKQPARISHFINHRLSDIDLPLIKVATDSTGNIFELRRREARQTPLPKACFDEDDITTADDFEDWQWTTLAPYFAKGPKRRVRFYSLDERDKLPWTEKEKLKEGGFSEVYRISIHPAHHEFGDSEIGDGTFALKKLRDSAAGTPESSDGPESVDTATSYTRHDFEREVDVLRRFSGDAHPHLVSLLSAFQKGNQFYLLFHWAEGDLKHFWRTQRPGLALDKRNLSWMIKQFRGIADGLQHIHDYKETNKNKNLAVNTDPIFGRHGDIKPENLLLFKRKNVPDDKGIIQLSDFGLAKFHSEHSRSGIRPSHLIGISPTYRPPEVDFKDGRVSRAYDIWSLACVLLEFITWYLGGHERLMHYVNERKQKDLYGYVSDQFFEIVTITGPNQLGARVKLEVLQWINELHGHQSCSEPIHDLLDFIEKEMLVVLPSDLHALHTTARRANCGEVFRKFDTIYKKLVEPTYHLKASPRSGPKPVPSAVLVVLNAEVEQKATRRISELRRHEGRLLYTDKESNGYLGGIQKRSTR